MALAAIGDVLQHAFVLRGKLGVLRDDVREFIGEIFARCNGGKGVRGKALDLGEGHGFPLGLGFGFAEAGKLAFRLPENG